MNRHCLALAFLAGLTLSISTGCQSGPMAETSKWMPESMARMFGIDNEVEWADKDNPAVRCVCLWQSADGTWEGQPTRGFGGQVFFLDRQSGRPVAVNGDVRVHVFDDHGPRKQRAKPVHTFDFTKGAWNAFLVKTQFGPAYNVFIPYTREGHHKTECALRIRLVEKEAPTVFSDMSYVRLEGSEKTDPVRAEELAGVPRRSDEGDQTSRTDGRGTRIGQVTPSGGLQAAERPSLSSDLEARLATLQTRMPVKRRPTSTTGDAAARVKDASKRLAQIRSDLASPRTGAPAKSIPEAFTPPAAAKPIKATAQADTLDQTGTRSWQQANAPRTRHTLEPAHVLEPHEEEAPPTGVQNATASLSKESHRIQARKTIATKSTLPTGAVWLDGASVTPRGDFSGFERTIGQAEAAATGGDWATAIRLASQVDRDSREALVSWPLDRPTPSALVAGWEVQRIDRAVRGDSLKRAERVDSRINDYLKASRAKLDADNPAEARRLATVAHLMSRAMVPSENGAQRQIVRPQTTATSQAVEPSRQVEAASPVIEMPVPAIDPAPASNSRGIERTSFELSQPAKAVHPLLGAEPADK